MISKSISCFSLYTNLSIAAEKRPVLLLHIQRTVRRPKGCAAADYQLGCFDLVLPKCLDYSFGGYVIFLIRSWPRPRNQWPR